MDYSIKFCQRWRWKRS